MPIYIYTYISLKSQYHDHTESLQTIMIQDAVERENIDDS